MMPFYPSTAREGDNHRAPQSGNVVLVATLSILASSAVVALAYWLGATWLSLPAFGIPSGVWVVVLISAYTARLQRTQAARGNPSLRQKSGQPRSALAAWTARTRLFLARSLNALLDTIIAADAVLASTPLKGFGLDRAWRARAARMLSSFSLPTSPLRVGFAMPRRKAGTLIDQDPTGAEWYLVSRELDPAEALAAGALDAIVTEPAPSVLNIETLEREGADSSWFDWNARRPLSYESVFPLRIDPSRIHLDLSSGGEFARSAGLVADLVHAAALLSRHPLRLDVQDRILGRTCSSRWGMSQNATEPLAVDEYASAMTRLAATLEHRARGERPNAADRAAARAVSAWLASWDDSISEEDRARWAETCARVVPDEPEVMLRLACVRLSGMDDEMGIAALRDADQMLQSEQVMAVGDPIAFLQAELEHGPENPMTVARVAAGLCLAIAGVPTDRLAFFQEDLLDDMRFATWLVGRDQDRAILLRVLRDLRESRERRETLAADQQIPPSQAA